jgi:hypothetical protein
MISEINTEEVKLVILSDHLDAATEISSLYNTNNRAKRFFFCWILVNLDNWNVLSVCSDINQVLFFIKYHRKSFRGLGGDCMHTEQRVSVPDFEKPIFAQRKNAVDWLIADDEILENNLSNSICMSGFT